MEEYLNYLKNKETEKYNENSIEFSDILDIIHYENLELFNINYITDYYHKTTKSGKIKIVNALRQRCIFDKINIDDVQEVNINTSDDNIFNTYNLYFIRYNRKKFNKSCDDLTKVIGYTFKYCSKSTELNKLGENILDDKFEDNEYISILRKTHNN